MKQAQRTEYLIDLNKIEGTGDFPCPNCGVIISPEDETESVYSISETKLRDESLEQLVILCHRCGSKIRVVGFLSSQSGPAETETETETNS